MKFSVRCIVMIRKRLEKEKIFMFSSPGVNAEIINDQ